MSHREIFGEPTIDRDAFVDPTATLIGDVRIDPLVLVAPSASLRADEAGPFKVCRGSNIQDTVVFHGHKGKYVHGGDGERYSIFVEEMTTVAHRALLHGPLRIGKKTFVGANTIVWGAVVGEGCFIRNGARIENARIGSNCLIGVNAVILDVDIPDGKYVHHNRVIEKPKDVLTLPDVRVEKIEMFRAKNSDIIEINHQLVRQHQERARLMREEADRQEFERLLVQSERRLEALRSHPLLEGQPDMHKLGTALVEAMLHGKREELQKGVSRTARRS